MENKLLSREAIRENIECLCLRIEDRFPETGLHEVCRLLLGTIDEAQAKIAWISQARWSIRGLVIGIVVLILAGLIAAIANLEIDYGTFGFSEFLHSLDKKRVNNNPKVQNFYIPLNNLRTL